MNNPFITVILKREAPNPKHEPIHQKSIQLVEEAIQSLGLSYKICSRHVLNSIKKSRLIISVGGDGTFLHASHLLGSNQVLMGINSVPQASHGAYCLSDAKQFKKNLQLYLSNKLKATPLYRISASVNGKEIFPYALNDILFCNPCPAGTSRYKIKVGKKSEEHKSSGIWISTATGSSAAICSAGGKVFKAGSDKIQYLVREPFQQGWHHVSLKKGFINPKEKLIIQPQMPQACIYIDGSHHKIQLAKEDVLTLQCASTPVFALIRK